MELSRDEMQYILNAVDTHVRTNGLNAAGLGMSVASKIQAMANGDGQPALKPDEPDAGNTPAED